MAAPEEPVGAVAAAPPPRTSGLAIASLVLGILTVVACMGPFAGIPAIVCGHLARRDCRRDPSVGGDGLALGGLIVGYVGTALWLVMALLWVALLAVRVSAVGVG